MKPDIFGEELIFLSVYILIIMYIHSKNFKHAQQLKSSLLEYISRVGGGGLEIMHWILFCCLCNIRMVEWSLCCNDIICWRNCQLRSLMDPITRWPADCWSWSASRRCCWPRQLLVCRRCCRPSRRCWRGKGCRRWWWDCWCRPWDCWFLAPGTPRDLEAEYKRIRITTEEK